MVNVQSAPQEADIKSTSHTNQEELVPISEVVDLVQTSVQDALRKVMSTYGLTMGTNLDVATDSTDEDVQGLIQQLTQTKQANRILSQKIDALEAEKRLTDEKLGLQFLVIGKLKQELVDERLASIDLKKELVEYMMQIDATANTIDEETDAVTSTTNPWQSPSQSNETTTNAKSLFQFYSSVSNDNNQTDDSELPSPLSASRGSLMDQFIPASLLDSPCVTPSSYPMSARREKHLPTLPSIEGFSLDETCGQCNDQPAYTVQPCQHTICTTCKENANGLCPRCKQPAAELIAIPDENTNQIETKSTNLVTLALMSEIFDTVSVTELDELLKASNGNILATIDAIVQDHASFNPEKIKLTGNALMAGARISLNAQSLNNWKTEMCMYYLQGKCNKTRRTCSFAHGETDLVRTGPSVPKPLKSRLCPLYLEGACPKSRQNCPLAHGESDLIPVMPSAPLPPGTAPGAPRLQNYKTELCYYYLKGCCNYSTDECRFAHGESDLRTIESNTMEWTGAYDGVMNLQHQQLYQQQALSLMQQPPPPPPGMLQYRFLPKEDLTKRRVTIPARRESMNALPNWTLGPNGSYEMLGTSSNLPDY